MKIHSISRENFNREEGVVVEERWTVDRAMFRFLILHVTRDKFSF